MTTTVAPIWLAGDFTGDGYPDVLEYATGFLGIHANDGLGKLTMSASSSVFVDLSSPPVSAVSISLADLNGDECADIVMSTTASGHRVFLGTCTTIAGNTNIAITYPASPQTVSVTGCSGPSVVFDANIDGYVLVRCCCFWRVMLMLVLAPALTRLCTGV